jgi:hypothetical protein
LPALLKALKARGYRIVQVVPAGPDRPKTVAPPEAWATRHTPTWPRVLEQDPAFAQGSPAVDQIDLPISVGSAPGEPEILAVPLVYPTPGRSRLWPGIAREFEPADSAKPLPVAITGGAAAVAVSDIGLAWSVEHVVWPPASKPVQFSRRKTPIHFRRSAAARPHRPRVGIPSPGAAKPLFASHILTLH